MVYCERQTALQNNVSVTEQLPDTSAPVIDGIGLVEVSFGNVANVFAMGFCVS
jgi:hypothetical protein